MPFSQAGTARLNGRINTAAPEEEKVLVAVEALHKAAGKPFGEEQRDDATALLRLSSDVASPVEKRAEAVAGQMGVTVKKDDPVEKTDGKCTKCGELVKAGEFCAKCGTKHLGKAEPKPEDPLAALLKSDSPVAKAIAGLVEKAAKVEELEKTVAALTAKDADAVAVAKASEATKPIGVTPEAELVALIKAAPDAAYADKLLALVRSKNQQLASAALFSELGAIGSPIEGSAEAVALAKAEGLQKADPKLTKEQALVKALEADPALYARYQAEKGGK